MTANNSTIFVGGDVGVVQVEQGPAAVAELLYAPPAWVEPVGGVLTLLLFVGGVIGYRRCGFDREVLCEMGGNVAALVGAWLAVNLSLAYLHLPYWGDVLVGGVGALASTAIVGYVLEEAVSERDQD